MLLRTVEAPASPEAVRAAAAARRAQAAAVEFTFGTPTRLLRDLLPQTLPAEGDPHEIRSPVMLRE